MIASWMPIWSGWLLVAWLLLMVAMPLAAAIARRRRLRLASRLGLLASSIGAAVTAAVFLAQPMGWQERPTKGASRVLVLADTSVSMETVDAGTTESRLAVLQSLLNSQVTVIKQLIEYSHLEVLQFPGDLVPVEYVGGTPQLEARPGLTAIGDALRQAERLGERGSPLGAVLLLSDGRNVDGCSPVEVAKSLHAKGIPLHCVEIGRSQSAIDLRVELREPHVNAVQDEPFTLNAVVSGYWPGRHQLEVQLLENSMVLERQQIEVEDGGPVSIAFSCKAVLPGFHSYQLRLVPPLEDSRMDNNLDYAAVTVHAPAVCHVLYLGGGLDWEWRFLHRTLQDDPQFHVDAIIQMAPDRFFTTMESVQPEEHIHFPETAEAYADVQVVLLDTRAAATFSPQACEALCSFVEHKGGGLMLHGPVDRLPDALRHLAPVRPPALPLRTEKTLRLEAAADFLFPPSAMAIMESGRGLWLPAGTVLWTGSERKQAARDAVSMSLPKGTLPLLVMQGVGAGRCAALSMEESWRWRLGEKDGGTLYKVFWSHLLRWLGEMDKAPVSTASQGVRASVGEVMTLDMSVLGMDFQPAADARANVEITLPDGELRELALEPDLELPGRYVGEFLPLQAGEHQLRYHAVLGGDGTERTLFASFVARETGPETAVTEVDEELLRNLAQAGGGRFYTAEEFRRADHLPLSTNVPKQVTIRPLASSWWLLGLFIGCSLILWWMRRRLGMK